MTKLLELKNIVKTYMLGSTSFNALNNVDLVINEGEFCSIMGQSGSGKSTLMNIIGMLDTPTSGEYFFKGKDISILTDDDQAIIRRISIGFIFQTYNLLPKTPAIKQVMLPLMYQGVDPIEREERAKQALIKVGLGDRLNSLPTEMSGGQQQRVAIARAIVTNPALILADEPTGALDSNTGKEVMELITKLNEEGKTIVLITHDVNVGNYAKRSIKIKDGQIV